ncbi:MAG: NAD(P)/FAD-dependent oxidoreductase [Acidimicrobiia bacterium]|nr:NAD(P)/FAD-dependent oxidoreductase [Acidimicrobiia bacterium]
MDEPNERPHVVIIGAGFGGLAAAAELRDDPVDITIVDRANFHTFLPLLYQVATAGLNPADVAHPIRGIVQRQGNVRVRRGTVVGVDWEARQLEVETEAGPLAPLGFDHLIVAAGSTANFFGIPGAAELGFPLYALDDATALRNHVLACFEAADADSLLLDSGILTFVVVGGGPTGVEVAGALAELFSHVLRRDFGALEVGHARVVLVEMAESLLLNFDGSSQGHALDALRERGVEVVLGDSVEEVTATEVALSSGRRIASHTMVWAAGVRANDVASTLDVDVGRGGRIDVGTDLSIPGRSHAYAIGDIANVPVPGEEAWVPQLAPAAQQAGRHAARQIRARLAGRPTTEFRYRDKGIMATIGRRSAVAELPFGIRLSGTLAWFAWLGLHLLTLVGFRNRLSVFLNWAWNYATWDRGPRLILGTRRRPT